MKKTLHISASFDEPEFVQNLVERLAYRRNELGFDREIMPKGLKALETSSTETYVSGTIALDFPADNEEGKGSTCPL
jgi:paraquat-inducible protein B